MKALSLLRLPALALLLVLPLALAACSGDGAADDGAGGTATPMLAGEQTGEATPAAPVQARMEDGVQVVEIEVGRMGYAPGAVTLEAGVPARLVFTRTVDSECSSQVRIPDFDVPATDLPMNEPVAIEVTPDEGGTFTFICGMEMQRGSILVRS